MVDSDVDELQDVCVGKCVVNDLARFTVPDQPSTSQYAELVGNCGLRHAEHRREVAHAQLALCKGVKKSHSRRIAEHLEDFCSISNKLMIKHVRSHVVDGFFVYAEDVTRITHI